MTKLIVVIHKTTWNKPLTLPKGKTKKEWVFWLQNLFKYKKQISNLINKDFVFVLIDCSNSQNRLKNTLISPEGITKNKKNILLKTKSLK